MASQGVNVSRDLLWILTKNHNSFMFKRPGISKRFSTDPMNAKGIQTLKHSGSLYQRAINVQPDPSGKGVVLLHKVSSNQSKLAKSVNKVSLKKSSRRTLRSIKRFVNGSIESSGYRPDLKRTVLRRASAILKSQRKRKTKLTPKSGKTGKKD